MRKRSSCSSYQCSNGSPYGNAFGDGSRRAVQQGLVSQEREQQEGLSLLERIDSIEAEANRNLIVFSQLSAHIASAPAVFIGIAAAHNLPLICSLAAVLFSKIGLLAIVLFLSLRSRLEARRAHWERERNHQARHGANNVPPGDTEEQILAEAMRRSIEEY